METSRELSLTSKHPLGSRLKFTPIPHLILSLRIVEGRLGRTGWLTSLRGRACSCFASCARQVEASSQNRSLLPP
eukprot:760845-Hanusia_phi.AAC.1